MDSALLAAQVIETSAVAHPGDDMSILGLAIKHTRAGKLTIDDLKLIKAAADQYISCYNIVETHLRAQPRDVVRFIQVDRLAGLCAEALINLTDAGLIDPDKLMVGTDVLSANTTARDILNATVDGNREHFRAFMSDCVIAGFMIRGVDPVCQL